METNNINNGKKVANAPLLRFPEFKDKWKSSIIGDLFDLYSGNTPSRLNKNSFTGNVNWITSGELKNHYIGDTIEKLTIESAKECKLKILPIGTFVMAIYGLEAEGVRSTCSITTQPSTISQACMAFTPKDCVNNEFLYSWYKKHGNIIGLRYAQGTKQQNLSYDILEKFELAYPTNIKEQQKLIDFVALLDKRIEIQKSVIEKLKSLKSAIVDTIISRLYQCHSLVKISEICSIADQIKDENPSLERILTVKLHCKGIRRSVAENLLLGATTYYIRKKGQIIYGKQNFHNGAIAIIPENLDGGITSKDIPSFEIDKEKCDPYFLLIQLQQPAFYEKAEAYTTGTGSKRLKEEAFLNLEIVLPSLREQTQIAETVKSISLKIENESLILNKLISQKTYLLSKMFI